MKTTAEMPLMPVFYFCLPLLAESNKTGAVVKRNTLDTQRWFLSLHFLSLHFLSPHFRNLMAPSKVDRPWRVPAAATAVVQEI